MAKKPQAIKPTTMRIPPDLLKRAEKEAKRQERSRTFIIVDLVRKGLDAADKEAGRAGAFA